MLHKNIPHSLIDVEFTQALSNNFSLCLIDCVHAHYGSLCVCVCRNANLGNCSQSSAEICNAS